jgi:clan AA aspartic protease (TIGR02281 family)
MYKIVLLIFLSIISLLSFAQTTIEMEKKNGVYYVPCLVNGLKLKFIFDTGASDVSISLSEAAFMLKNGYLDKEDIKGKEYYSIASGEIAEGTKVTIKQLEIGGKTLFNVEASIVHTLSAPLLLGQSALQKFGSFSIDYSTNSLIIGKQVKSSATSISVNSQTDIKYYNTHHLYYTVVGLNLYDPSTKSYAGQKELSGTIDLDIPNRLIIVTTTQGVNKFEILKTSIFTIDNNESALEVIIKDEKNESVVFSNNPKLVVFNPIKADAKTLTFVYSNITTD